MSTEPLSIGIDFGTSNSAMAWFNRNGNQAEIILNAEGEAKTSSLVYFGESEVLVGKPVEDLLEDSEHYEEEERLDITQRVVKSIKRNLVDPPVIPLPGGRLVRPVEVVAEILRKLKRDAEEGHFDEEVERAVITCPAVFGSMQRKAIFDGAALAGFRVVDLVEEPVAAAMAFAHLGQKVGRGVLVYDLGGGTFDLAVVTQEEDESEGGSFRVAMEPDGDARCGGDDFDRALYEHCDYIARETLGRPIDAAEGAVNPYLLNECRKQKERLSYREKVTVRDYLNGVLFKAEVDRPTFEGMIAGRVEETVQKTAATVERAKRRGHEVDTVVLIGGSSQVPLVTQRLEKTLSVAPRRFANKDYAVALGAAYYTSVLEIPAPEQYRRALEISWADEKLNREEVEHLSGLVEELGLGKEETAKVEREVLSATMGAILERQRQEYRKAVDEARDLLNRLANELGLGRDEAAGIKREVFSDLGLVSSPETEKKRRLIARICRILDLRVKAIESHQSRTPEQGLLDMKEPAGTLGSDQTEPRRSAINKSTLPSSGREQGRVKWFDPEKGYGFLVRPTGEDLFVYHQEVEGNLSDLEPGREVEYVVVRNERGPNARRVRVLGMTVEIYVPDFGESITEATVGKWLKEEGDQVKTGEPIVELETDKANFEIEAEQDGVLKSIAKGEGEDVEIGDVIGTIGEPDEDVDGSGSVQDRLLTRSRTQLTGRIEIYVPEFGESITEATVGKWLKQEGDRVTAGEPIVELETDKANFEVEAEQDGVLESIAVGEGEDVEVGDVIGIIAQRSAANKSTLPSSDRERGRVKWFEPEKGYGFLVGPTGEDLFVHHSEVEGDPYQLEPGTEVEYVVGYTDRGPVARNVIPFLGAN